MRGSWAVVGFIVLALSCGSGCGGDDDDGAGAADGGSSPGSAGSTSGSGKLDACKLVTAADAGALFGKPAERDEDAFVTDPALLGQCQWTYEVEDEIGSVSSQSLQFYVWGSPEYNSPHPNADPLDVGEDGSIHASEATGVDVGWVQDGRAIALSYFSIGDDMPANLSKVDAMKSLAAEVSGRL